MYELVNDARLSNIDVLPPDLRDIKKHFYLKDKVVYFGLSDVKQIGISAVDKISNNISELPKDAGSWRWVDYLIFFL